jgi:hypothetical protein
MQRLLTAVPGLPPPAPPQPMTAMPGLEFGALARILGGQYMPAMVRAPAVAADFFKNERRVKDFVILRSPCIVVGIWYFNYYPYQNSFCKSSWELFCGYADSSCQNVVWEQITHKPKTVIESGIGNVFFLK